MLSRRQFIQMAVVAGAAAAVPPMFEAFRQPAQASSEEAFFLSPERWAVCEALCSRIVPTGSDAATDPGATEAHAVVFIDRFLAAFELPASVADNPAVWVTGNFSGRNPEPGSGGYATSDYPPDAFLSDSGVAHFLALDSAQSVYWYVQLYGSASVAERFVWADKTWASQLAGLIPVEYPQGLRQLYAAGLDAFDEYSKSSFGVPFSQASPEEQDLMLAVAGNLVLDSISGNLPVALPSPPAAPPAASALVPAISLHTFQATYGLPEYAWLNQNDDPGYVEKLGGTAQWRSIRYDGDTEPLGNTIFVADQWAPGEGPNAGFGAPPGSPEAAEGVFVPFGGYVEFRPVSTLGDTGPVLSEADGQSIKSAIVSARSRA